MQLACFSTGRFRIATILKRRLGVLFKTPFQFCRAAVSARKVVRYMLFKPKKSAAIALNIPMIYYKNGKLNYCAKENGDPNNQPNRKLAMLHHAHHAEVSIFLLVVAALSSQLTNRPPICKHARMSAVAPQAVQQGFFRLCRLPACPSPCDCDATQRQTVVVVGPWAELLRDVPRHPCPLQ